MNYNELKEIAKSKNILVKDLATAINITRQGLQKVMDNGTIELNKVKEICIILKVSPLLFFDTVNTGVYISGNNQIGNGNKLSIESKDREIELLKQRLADKDEIIKLLREKNNKTGYGLVADH
jgi:DNA-binding Xre family transcriptional regulator